MDVSKNFITSASSQEGAFVTSTTTAAPFSASAMPSPVTELTPELASTEAFLPSAVGTLKLLIRVSKKGRCFLWKNRGSYFSVGPMKLRRTYLAANQEYKNEQLTGALFTYLGVVNSWCVGLPEKFLLVAAAA